MNKKKHDELSSILLQAQEQAGDNEVFFDLLENESGEDRKENFLSIAKELNMNLRIEVEGMSLRFRFPDEEAKAEEEHAEWVRKTEAETEQIKIETESLVDEFLDSFERMAEENSAGKMWARHQNTQGKTGFKL